MERSEGGEFVWPSLLGSAASHLLEPVTAEPGVIEPSVRFPEERLPQRCVLCFFEEVLEGLKSLEGCEFLPGLGSEIGAKEVFVLEHKGERLAVCHPGVGGPLAAATLEELIALGCRDFLVCGGAGSLLPEQTLGHLVVVEKALRDEGVSHHYLAPGSFLKVDPELLKGLVVRLQKLKVVFTQGATWTTDALYRETKSRIERRRLAGCLTVEMEMAALLAVAEYRGARLGGLLYCGDDVGSETWDFRDWTQAKSVRAKLFWLTVEALRAV
jgi:uridine phosphorylase